MFDDLPVWNQSLFFSISLWGKTGIFFELAAKIVYVGKTALKGDIFHCHVGPGQQLLCMLHAALGNIVGERNAHLLGKQCGKIAGIDV